MKPKYKFLSGDVNWLEYGGKWISQQLSNGEFNYWLVIELVNMDDACGRDNAGQPKYNVSLSAVSPSEAGENLAKALESCGMADAQADPVAQVEALHSYGVSAHLWSANGNNAHKLLQEARRQPVDMLFGFYMDRPENRIGTTGWEAIKGDLNSAMARTIASGSPEGVILGKMHGIHAA